jgi:hypothetical protein
MLEWLLGLERIDLAEDQPLMLHFATPPAPWIMLFGAVLAAAVVYWLYRREAVASRWLWALSIARFALIMTVLFIIGRPMLVLRRTQVDPSVVSVLVDSSASVLATDEVPDSTSRPQRWTQMLDSLTDNARGLLPSLVPAHEIQLCEFGQSLDQVGRLKNRDEIAPLLTRLSEHKPEGPRTNISEAVEQVLQRTLDSRLAAIIVVSDGRQTSPPKLDRLVSTAQSRAIPIHVLAAGSTAPRKDIAVENVRTQERVCINDSVLIRAALSSAGYDKPLEVQMQLKDTQTGEVISSISENLTPEIRTKVVDFVYQPTRPGKRLLELAATSQPSEDNTANNARQFAIEAIDQKIGVLYVEGEPRYEYRYLKNLLIRESTIDSSCLLLSASSSFPQEGSRPIRQFPQSVEELRHYDVILLGDVDVRGDWLSHTQQRMILDFVAEQAGGIAFIAGPNNMPHRVAGSPLEKLLPVRIDPPFQGEYESDIVTDFPPSFTRDGRDHPIFRFAATTDANSQPADAPGWYWFARVLGSRPASSVLAQHPSITTTAGPLPLVVLGRFGAGRTFYAGTDEMWRWRQYSGDTYYNHIWLQVFRTLARNRKLGGACPLRLDTDRQEYQLGQPVIASLSTNDLPITTGPDEVELIVRDAHESLVHRAGFRSETPDNSARTAQFVPQATGLFTIAVDSSSPDCRLTRTIRVIAPDPEREHLEADHDFLRTLATRTHGRFLTMSDDASSLAKLIPSRERRVVDDVEESIWDSPLLIILFVTLAFAEWTTRRLLGLS